MTDTDIAPEATPTADDFHRRLASTERDVRATLIAFSKWMRAHRIGEDDLGTAEIVLAEVLNNVVEHAYAARPDGWIDLVVVDRGGHLAVAVTDGGAAMPTGRLPSTELPSAQAERAALPEGGFGWALIRQLAQDLVYDREKGSNHLSLTLSCTDRKG